MERSDQFPRPGGVEVLHGRHVDARRERATRSLEDDDAERGVSAELTERDAEAVDEGGGEDVERIAVQREARDPALAREAQLSHAALVAGQRRVHLDGPRVDSATQVHGRNTPAPQPLDDGSRALAVMTVHDEL